MKIFYTTQRKYKHNKLVYWIAMIIILFVIFTVMLRNEFDFSTKIYFECKQEICDNPLYYMRDCQQQLNILWFIPLYKTADCREKCTERWCNEKYVSRGVYGEKPDSLLGYAPIIAFAVFLLAFLINHFFWNRGKVFDIEIPITKKLIINRDKIKEWNKKNEGTENNSKD